MDITEIMLFAVREHCCGCGTCVTVCPVKAIQMVPGELGCLYPQIDQTECIRCGKCLRFCAYQARNLQEERAIPKAFAATAGDAAVKRHSASGGVFAALAQNVLTQGGVVFGCSLELSDGVLTPRHICIEDRKDLGKLQGSKYMQSDLGSSFVQVKQMLAQGRTVLFSGTPCQVDSLRHFMAREDTTNLYTVDIICHGVPSAKLFQDYLNTFRHPIQSFSFRDKTTGWGLNGSYICRLGNAENKTLFSPGTSSYYSYFLESEIYRESCYSCRYANLNRVGDLTIGDYWGFDQEHPALLAENGGPFEIQHGISALLVNTEMGQQLLNRFGQGLVLSETTTESIARWNRQLQGPSVSSSQREDILQQYAAHGYPGVEMLFRKKLGLRFPVRKIREMYRNCIKNRV